MRIMLTGANGFLGSHLVKHFVNTGDEVYAVSLNAYRLIDVMDKIQFSACPINVITSLEKRIHEFNPDIILHLAWTGGNNYASINNNFQFKKNLPGLADLMEIMERHNLHRFICVGSAAEYGDHKGIIKENNKENPTSLYGTCKLMAKQYSEQFCKSRGIDWTWLRPFYTFGPEDVPTRLVPSVITKCLKKEEIQLNDCEMWVDYLYISDFVDAVDSLIDKRKTGVYNVCSGKANMVKNLIDDIATKTNNESNIKMGVIPNRPDMPDSILGTHTKLSTSTGWYPKIGLNEGLTKTIEYYKNL